MLPGIAPAARMVLEVLLGPGGEIDLIQVTVKDPSGHLIAQRTWPMNVRDRPIAQLEVAWRSFLNAMPYETLAQRNHNK